MPAAYPFFILAIVVMFFLFGSIITTSHYDTDLESGYDACMRNALVLGSVENVSDCKKAYEAAVRE